MAWFASVRLFHLLSCAIHVLVLTKRFTISVSLSVSLFMVLGMMMSMIIIKLWLVRLTRHKFHNGSRFMTRTMVEVYSLKLDFWSMVEVVSHWGEAQHLGNDALIGSHLLHWSYWYIQYATYQISYFDLWNDRLGDDVPLPDLSLESDMSRQLIWYI